MTSSVEQSPLPMDCDARTSEFRLSCIRSLSINTQNPPARTLSRMVQNGESRNDKSEEHFQRGDTEEMDQHDIELAAVNGDAENFSFRYSPCSSQGSFDDFFGTKEKFPFNTYTNATYQSECNLRERHFKPVQVNLQPRNHDNSVNKASAFKPISARGRSSPLPSLRFPSPPAMLLLRSSSPLFGAEAGDILRDVPQDLVDSSSQKTSRIMLPRKTPSPVRLPFKHVRPANRSILARPVPTYKTGHEISSVGVKPSCATYGQFSSTLTFRYNDENQENVPMASSPAIAPSNLTPQNDGAVKCIGSKMLTTKSHGGDCVVGTSLKPHGHNNTHRENKTKGSLCNGHETPPICHQSNALAVPAVPGRHEGRYPSSKMLVDNCGSSTFRTPDQAATQAENLLLLPSLGSIAINEPLSEHMKNTLNLSPDMQFCIEQGN